MQKKHEIDGFAEKLTIKITHPNTLFWYPFIIAAIGLMLAFLYALSIFITEQLFFKNVCFRPECIEYFKDTFLPVYQVIGAIFTFIIGVVTVLVAFTAVHTYQISVKNTALANHIAHFNLFRDYLIEEVK